MNKRGQYSIIAALLVAVVLIATVITTYSTIRNLPLAEQPQVLSAIDETNLALKQILGFTVGYYGSILQVTGNRSYAYAAAYKYLMSGLDYIARTYPQRAISFNLTTMELQTRWFTNHSYSKGKIAVKYDLNGLGIYGITYETSCKLNVNVTRTEENKTRLLVTADDNNEPVINLGRDNFKFYRYRYTNYTWELVSPTGEFKAFANGTYLIKIPPGIDPYSYVVQVEDHRGIVTAAASFSRYVCTLDWNDPFYAPLLNAADATIVVELLQNGTMRWLGQNLNQVTQAKPIPPIPVKAIHVNQTIDGVNREVPFQIEDWVSEYQIPLSLTSNASVFSNRNMIVFLVNPKVSKVTIWWNVSDTATQTALAYTNKYFTFNKNQKTLNNKIITIKIDSSEGSPFRVISTKGQCTANAVFMRINGKNASFGWSEPMYSITNGPVRAVLHHEVEWNNSGAPNCKDVYAHIVLSLPANATYYTYQLRFMFVDSQQSRSITDLCPIRIGAGQVNDGDFGYKYTSTQYTTVNKNEMCGSLFSFSASSDAFAKSISFYGSSDSGTASVKCLIVRHSDMHIIAVTNPVQVTQQQAQWYTATFPYYPVLSPNTEYVLMIIPNKKFSFYYSAGSANQGHIDTSNNYDAPTDPTDVLHDNRKYSIYCTYIPILQQTENGTASGYPIVSNQPGVFYGSPNWQHHWSQIVSTSTQGAGIMFTDSANQMLYIFDPIAGTTTGALNVTLGKIQLCPVTSAPASFTYPLDVKWCGAVVTFDSTTTPIYKSDRSGLWVLVEHPPTVTVTTKN